MDIKIEDLNNVVKDSISISEVCRKLKLSNNGYTFKKIKELCNINKISINHFTRGKRFDYDVSKLKELVSTSTTYSEICRGFNVKTSGGNIRTIKKRIEENSLDISHFEGKSFTGKRRWKTGEQKKPLNEIMVENSTYSRYHLRNRLIKEGILPYVCDECVNLGMWRDKPLTLQLDHINGINNDHRLENLRFLCPNCHSQTKTYAGKNNG